MQLPPGPQGSTLLGSLGAFRANPLQFVESLPAYGDITGFRFARNRIVMVNHPDLVREVLVTQADKFYKSARVEEVLTFPIGPNVFASSGDFWKQQHKIIQPALHAKRIEHYANTMVHYANYEMRDWQDGATIDIDHAMKSVSMNVVAKSLFDADVSAETLEAAHQITTIFTVFNQRFQQALMFPRWLPTPSHLRLRRAVAEIRKMLKTAIDERRKTNEDRGDMLSLLLKARYEDGSPMSDDEILAEIVTVFTAGHDTTASTMMWAWYEIARNPEVQERMYHEIDTVLGGRTPTLDDLNKLTYLEKVIKETLRLYPPGWLLLRRTIEEVELCGYKFPKKMPVFLCPWNLARDPRWFNDPLRFDPERFSPEREGEIPKYAYLPFGGGPRICSGIHFAMMEARFTLATIAQRYKLSLVPGFEPTKDITFILRAGNGMHMVAHARS